MNSGKLVQIFYLVVGLFIHVFSLLLPAVFQMWSSKLGTKAKVGVVAALLLMVYLLFPASSYVPPSAALASYSPTRVKLFLDNNGFQNYSSQFLQRRIDGDLLALMDEHDFTALGIEMAPLLQKKLLKTIRAKVFQDFSQREMFDFWTARAMHPFAVNVILLGLLKMPRLTLSVLYLKYYSPVLLFLYPEFSMTFWTFLSWLFVPHLHMVFFLPSLLSNAPFTMFTLFWTFLYSWLDELGLIFFPSPEISRTQLAFRDLFKLIVCMLYSAIWPGFLPDLIFWVFYVRYFVMGMLSTFRGVAVFDSTAGIPQEEEAGAQDAQNN